jgi:hypothetical protein
MAHRLRVAHHAGRSLPLIFRSPSEARLKSCRSAALQQPFEASRRGSLQPGSVFFVGTCFGIPIFRPTVVHRRF